MTEREGDRLITIQEACEMLRRSPSTVYRMIKSGDIRTLPCPKRPLVLLSSVERFIAGEKKAEVATPPRKLAGRARRR